MFSSNFGSHYKGLTIGILVISVWLHLNCFWLRLDVHVINTLCTTLQQAESPRDLLELWPQQTERVNELYRCSMFRRRTKPRFSNLSSFIDLKTWKVWHILLFIPFFQNPTISVQFRTDKFGWIKYGYNSCFKRLKQPIVYSCQFSVKIDLQVKE